jgi:Coenzyme PQQ synthesis protein D (PqqD)
MGLPGARPSADGGGTVTHVVKTYRLRSRGLTWRKVENRVVILDLDSSSYFALNETASAVWDSLEAGVTIDVLVERLLDQFEVEPEQARRDVIALLDQLEERGVLR